jgi:ElaB/YqjD/DUF883 family membrane-anchored ribosome-binding protein
MSKNSPNRYDRSEILKHLKEIAKNEDLDLNELAANIASQLDTLSSQLDTLTEKAKEKINDVSSQVNETAHIHPWYFIGGAAALGFLLGRFLK